MDVVVEGGPGGQEMSMGKENGGGGTLNVSGGGGGVTARSGRLQEAKDLGVEG